MDDEPRRRRTDGGSGHPVSLERVYDFVGQIRREMYEGREILRSEIQKMADTLRHEIESLRKDTSDRRHKDRDDLSGAISGVRMDTSKDHDELSRRVSDLELWRAEVRGAITIVRIAFGTSVVAAIASLASLWRSLNP